MGIKVTQPIINDAKLASRTISTIVDGAKSIKNGDEKLIQCLDGLAAINKVNCQPKNNTGLQPDKIKDFFEELTRINNKFGKNYPECSKQTQILSHHHANSNNNFMRTCGSILEQFNDNEKRQ